MYNNKYMSDNNQNIEDVNREYIKDLYIDFRYSIEKFDTQIIYLSSGALAISLTFMESIVPIKEAVCLILHYSAIILFGFTILIGFIAHYISSKQIMKRMKQIEQNNFNVQNNPWMSFINKTIIVTLTLGISLLIIFTIINMNISNNKPIQSEIDSILIEELSNERVSIQIKGKKKNIYIDTYRIEKSPIKTIET